MGRLEGKRAIITGGGNGIGAAAALRFAQEGARVAILEIKKDAGVRSAAAVEAAGGQCLFLECDITQPEAVEAAITKVVGEFGGLEVLYNNAGGATAQDGSFLDMPLDEFWRTISVDLYGTFLASRYAVPHIRDGGGGSVINTASIRAMKGTRGADAYTSAKGGIVTLTKAMALQCAPMRIRVNAISPGAVLTERTQSVFGMTGDDDRDNPARPLRTGQPREIAEMALFLASDEASLVNGAIIPVDSGDCAF